MDTCIHRWVSNQRGDQRWGRNTGPASHADRKPPQAWPLESIAPRFVQKQKPSCRLPPQCRIQIMTASRLFPLVTPSPSCRLIKTTCSEAWPKIYSKLQLPRVLFHSGFQPTVGYQKISKRTSLPRKADDNNVSFSKKKTLIGCQDHRGMTVTCCPRSSKSFWRGFVTDITD